MARLLLPGVIMATWIKFPAAPFMMVWGTPLSLCGWRDRGFPLGSSYWKTAEQSAYFIYSHMNTCSFRPAVSVMYCMCPTYNQQATCNHKVHRRQLETKWNFELTRRCRKLWAWSTAPALRQSTLWKDATQQQKYVWLWRRVGVWRWADWIGEDGVWNKCWSCGGVVGLNQQNI